MQHDHRIPLEVIELEFGEDGSYTPPAEADRWSPPSVAPSIHRPDEIRPTSPTPT